MSVPLQVDLYCLSVTNRWVQHQQLLPPTKPPNLKRLSMSSHSGRAGLLRPCWTPLMPGVDDCFPAHPFSSLASTTSPIPLINKHLQQIADCSNAQATQLHQPFGRETYSGWPSAAIGALTSSRGFSHLARSRSSQESPLTSCKSIRT
jgi:hypothetical protein